MHEVCILITAYNAQPWIGEALDSALAQRGVDFEILIVDDGSTDETGAIAEEYQSTHPGVVRCIHIERKGLSAARNIGFDAADAEFVTVLDADDRMHPDRARIEIEGLRRHPNAAFCLSCRWNFPDGADEGKMSFTPEAMVGTDQPGFYLIEDPLTTFINAGQYPGTSACSSRLAFSSTVGRYDEQQPSCVDGELWIRTVFDRPVVYCSVPLYFRRVHPQSWSGSHPTRLQNIFRALDKAHSHWNDYSPAQQKALLAFKQRAMVSFTKGMVYDGRSAQARKILRENYRQFKGAYWWKVYLTSLLPLPLAKLVQKWRLAGSSAPKVKMSDLESLRPLEMLGLK